VSSDQARRTVLLACLTFAFPAVAGFLLEIEIVNGIRRSAVWRAGKEARLKPTLAEMPPDSLAMIVGLHMLEHAQVEDVAKK
jgi:hypothetical protein